MGIITGYSRFTPSTTPSNTPYGGTDPVVTTGTFIPFPVALPPGTSYRVSATCFNANGKIDYSEVRTLSGFTIYPVEDATFEWNIFVW
jgi:hypothetical protein